jgi:hypothetical protein
MDRRNGEGRTGRGRKEELERILGTVYRVSDSSSLLFTAGGFLLLASRISVVLVLVEMVAFALLVASVTRRSSYARSASLLCLYIEIFSPLLRRLLCELSPKFVGVLSAVLSVALVLPLGMASLSAGVFLVTLFSSRLEGVHSGFALASLSVILYICNRKGRGSVKSRAVHLAPSLSTGLLCYFNGHASLFLYIFLFEALSTVVLPFSIFVLSSRKIHY